MRIEQPDATAAKGRYLGPRNSPWPVAIGDAHAGIDEPHDHHRKTEVSLVARGEAEAPVEGQSVQLLPGDVLLNQLGGVHALVANSPDYPHFVLHYSGVAGADTRAAKVAAPLD